MLTLKGKRVYSTQILRDRNHEATLKSSWQPPGIRKWQGRILFWNCHREHGPTQTLLCYLKKQHNTCLWASNLPSLLPASQLNNNSRGAPRSEVSSVGREVHPLCLTSLAFHLCSARPLRPQVSHLAVQFCSTSKINPGLEHKSLVYFHPFPLLSSPNPVILN